jgi:hypothetical protein
LELKDDVRNSNLWIFKNKKYAGQIKFDVELNDRATKYRNSPNPKLKQKSNTNTKMHLRKHTSELRSPENSERIVEGNVSLKRRFLDKKQLILFLL